MRTVEPKVTVNAAIRMYINGNISDFKEWLRSATPYQLVKLATKWKMLKLDVRKLADYTKEIEKKEGGN